MLEIFASELLLDLGAINSAVVVRAQLEIITAFVGAIVKHISNVGSHAHCISPVPFLVLKRFILRDYSARVVLYLLAKVILVKLDGHTRVFLQAHVDLAVFVDADVDP